MFQGKDEVAQCSLNGRSMKGRIANAPPLPTVACFLRCNATRALWVVSLSVGLRGLAPLASGLTFMGSCSVVWVCGCVGSPTESKARGRGVETALACRTQGPQDRKHSYSKTKRRFLSVPSILREAMLRVTFVMTCVVAPVAALTVPASAFGRSPLTRVQRRSSAIFAQQLAPGWISKVDQQSGQTYYYNEQSGASQWEPPPQQSTSTRTKWYWYVDGFNGVAGFSGVADFAASNKYGDREYRLEFGREGRPCQLPYILGPDEEQVLTRWNMVEQKINVSKEQCTVKNNADGSATLVSTGRLGPTLWRAPGGPWNQLGKGQQHILSDGDQVSLDVNDPEAAVFTCSVQVAQASGQAPQASGHVYVQALSDFVAQQPEDLGFRAGDVVTVTQQGESGAWWEGSLNGQVGWFPSNFCSEPYN